MAHLPLAGIKVVDFCWIGAGSYTTKILADMGADVIKIESTKSLDSLRLAAPYKDGIKGVNRSGYFADRNSSKRSFTLNVKHKDGLKIAYDLIKECDIVSNNFTPGVMDKLGVGYEKLKEINPNLIFIGMSMNGDEGPERKMLGYGITISAATGLMASCGLPDKAPVGTGTNYPDHVPNPTHGAFAILAAMRHKRRTGEGQLIDMAQTEPMVALLAPSIMDYSANGHTFTRQGNRLAGCAPRGVFQTQGDDRWISLSVRNDNEWQGLLNVFSDQRLTNSAWATAQGREQDQEAIEAILIELCATQVGETLMSQLQTQKVPSGVVQTSADLVDTDPQIKHRNHWKVLQHSEMGASVYNGLPFIFASGDVGPRSPAPLLGQHTREICTEQLGLTDEDVTRLTEDGLFI